MKKAISLFLFLFFISPGWIWAAGYKEAYTSSHALVVGINKYPLWPHLEYAATDAEQVAGLLRDRGFNVRLLVNEKATRRAVLNGLETLKETVDSDARVVFYFAGHGQTEDLPGGGEQGYLVPVDADAYEWQDTMISMKEVNLRMKEIKAKHVLMAFDSCYSGLGLTRAIKRYQDQDAGYIKKMMQLRSVQILTAGGRSEQAVEIEGHGLFTDHLLAALSGVADMNHDGYTTGTEIYATLRESITRQSYNRQTPQFGYIEGEGDMIFFTGEETRVRSVLVVNSGVDGIDVWVGSEEVGRLLPQGVHRLDVNGGRKIILVKKGGKTLYKKTALLEENREFLVSVDSEEIPVAAIRKREPLSMHTIAHRRIRNYANSMAYDLDRDGVEEIVTVSGNVLFVFRADGYVLWKKQFPFPVHLDLLDEWEGMPVIALSGRDREKLHLALFNNHGERVWHKSKKIRQFNQGMPPVNARIAKLADISGNGRKEIIVFYTAKFARRLRGVAVFDQYGKGLWRQIIGSMPTSIALWKDESGKLSIIIGTHSTAIIGDRARNITDDMHSYVISLNPRGHVNWVTPLGPDNTGSKIMLADLDGDGSEELYAHKWTGRKRTPDRGAIYRISKDGHILYSMETKDSIVSMTASTLPGTKRNYLYASDKSGAVYKLSHTLSILGMRSLRPDQGRAKVELVGVHDYDGDGREEILLYTYNRLTGGREALAGSQTKDRVFYTSMRCELLSSDLSKVIRTVQIAKEWVNWRGFRVVDMDRPEAPYYPFMVLGDKITLFNFKSPSVRLSYSHDQGFEDVNEAWPQEDNPPPIIYSNEGRVIRSRPAPPPAKRRNFNRARSFPIRKPPPPPRPHNRFRPNVRRWQ